jgi:hypothetical protein
MPSRATKAPDAMDTVIDSVVDRIGRRGWPLLASVLFVIVGVIYFFRWGSVFHHNPSQWLSPGDLWDTVRASTSLVAGHLGAIYSSHSGFFSPPAFLIVLAPLSALRYRFNTTFVEVRDHGHLLAHPLSYHATSGGPYFTTSTAFLGAKQFAVHSELFVVLALYVLVLSCVVLLACDALAERLQIPSSRRAVLSVAEAVLLWNVVVIWGHPQDAIAVAFAIYSVIFALDRRFSGAGWLFGLALAFQPLTIVVFPILLGISGRNKALGLALRGVVPAAVLLIGPFVADFHSTYRSVVVQPAFPDTRYNHKTPWTSLAPTISGRGVNTTVGGGPLRVVVLALAAGLGWVVIRWRDRPEMVVWAVAVALALRCYLEAVMTPYYIWPALAVAAVVAARSTWPRFAIVLAVAIATTILAQTRMGLWPWWIVDVGGVTIVLAVAARPEPVPDVEAATGRRTAQAGVVAARPARPTRPTRPAPASNRARTATTKKKRKAARADRKRSARS